MKKLIAIKLALLVFVGLAQAGGTVTATSVESSGSPSSYGQNVTFTATVSYNSGMNVVNAEGTVTFSEGTNVLASGVSVNSSGQASFIISTLLPGTHTITADYSGSGTYFSSSGNTSQLVYSAVIYSQNSGNWSDTGTWSGGTVPTGGNVVIIQPGHTVNVDGAQACSSVYVQRSSTTGSSLIITNGNSLSVNNGVYDPSLASNSPFIPGGEVGIGNFDFVSGNSDTVLDVGGQLVAGRVYLAAQRYGNQEKAHAYLRISNSNAVVTVSGDIDQSRQGTQGGNPFANVEFTGTGGLLQVGGGFVANNGVRGTFSAGTGTVEYNGANGQTIHNFTYNNLVLNDANGGTLDGNTTVNGTLTLTNGIVSVGANNRTLTIGAAGSVSRTTGYVVGNLQKTFAAGAGVSRTFEVGTSTGATRSPETALPPSYYNPVTVTIGNVTNTGTITVRADAGDHASISTSKLNDTKSVNVNWTATDGGGLVFDTASAVFNFNPTDLDGSADVTSTNFIGGKLDGTTWTYPTVAARTTTNTTLSGLTSFSAFQLAEQRIPTTVDVSSSANPSVFSQGVTFTATVSPSSTGMVQFQVNGSNTGAPVSLNESSAVSDILTSLAVGTNTITANYLGNTDYAPSSGSVTQVVAKANTTSTLISQSNPSVFGQSIRFTNIVAGVDPGTNATPTGSVQFMIDGTNFGNTVNLSGGRAVSAAISTLIISNAHSIKAVYNGSASFNTSSNTLNQVVNPAPTGVDLTSNPNPSSYGQAVVFTATVTNIPPAVGTRTGTVTFKDGSTPLATVTVSGNVARYTNSTLATSGHTIFAEYSGDATHDKSTNSIVQTVNSTVTTTAVANAGAISNSVSQTVVFTATVTNAVGALVNEGQVSFVVTNSAGAQIGSTVIGNVSNGTATANFTLPGGTSAGTNIIVGTYADTGHFQASTGTGELRIVDTVETATAVTPVNVFYQDIGQTIQLKATVTGVITITNGTVSFVVTNAAGATNMTVGPVAVVNGVAATNVTLAGGTAAATYTIAASYTGIGPILSSTGTGNLTVNQAITTTTMLDTNVIFSASSQTVTVRATVTATNSTVNSGTIRFRLPATGSPIDNVSGVPVINGVATTNLTLDAGLAVGSYSIRATYTPGANFQGDNDDGTLTVDPLPQIPTTTSLGSSLNPSTYGAAVTLTATVSSTNGTPTGTVTLKDVFGGVTNVLGSPTLVSGSASVTTSTLGVGIHTILAEYSGGIGFLVSSTNLTQVVSKATPSLALTNAPNPSVFGQAVVFTATLSTNGATGTVTFSEGTNNLATVTVTGGAAAYTNAAFTVGAHVLQASYSGDTNYNVAASNLATQQVNQASTTIAVTSSLNPSVFGNSVSFTATVSATAPGTGTATGTVQFKTNGVNFGAAVALTSGSATSSLVSTLPVGTHTVTAEYAGSGSFKGNTNTLSGGQIVIKADSSVTVTSSQNPSTLGQNVRFTATVVAVAPGFGTPTGTVQFKTNGVNLGTPVTLAGGSAQSVIINNLPVSVHTVTAEYSGNSNLNGGTGELAGYQVVNDDNGIVMLSSSVNPSAPGQSVTFTATINSTAIFRVVQFAVDGVDVGGLVNVGGDNTASLTTSFTTPTNYHVTATYYRAGGSILMGSTELIQVVILTPPDNLEISINGSRNAVLTFTGNTNQVYRIQAAGSLSTNTAWTVIGTATNVSGSFQYEDIGTAANTNRFYRVITP